MVLNMVNPGINYHFYINPKTIEIVAIDLAGIYETYLYDTTVWTLYKRVTNTQYVYQLATRIDTTQL
jgi:hypothetical protein